MRSLKLLLWLALPTLLLFSCEEEFDINAPYKNITVVYGLLDLGADTTWVRINKAFLGEGDVLQMAMVEDSSIYKTGLHAVLEELIISGGDTLVVPTLLDSITVDSKVEGLFYNPYQLVYYAPTSLVASNPYRLRIMVKEEVVTGTTKIVNNFPITKPSAGSKFIHFTPGGESSVDWESARNGRRYEIVMRFRFKEVFADQSDTVLRFEDWDLGTKKSVNTQSGAEMTVVYASDGFYNFLLDRVPYDDPQKEALVMKRYTELLDVIISVAGEELNTYMEVNEPSNSIIQERPEYTNLTNGIGLFSSRFRNIRSKKLHPETIQNIQTLPVDLKFIY
jgi:hypothetical protein